MPAARLGTDDAAFEAVAEALRTTDSTAKWATVRLELPGADGSPVPVTVSGVAKGVGMIHPRMATMLAYVLTDAAVEPDGAVAAAAAGRGADLGPAHRGRRHEHQRHGVPRRVRRLRCGHGRRPARRAGRRFAEAVEAVCRSLARQQAADGEGATSLITCLVTGARDDAEARAAARAVVASSLFKAAVHGRDPNWGRIADALGNAQLADAAVLEAAGLPADEADARGGTRLDLDPDRVRISIAGTEVFAGLPVAFDAAAVSKAMDADEVRVWVDLGDGVGAGEAFGCDLTEEYVQENSEYST